MSLSSQSTESSTKAPVADATIECADGHRLGTVRSVRGGYFEVAAPMGADFWLSTVYVSSADDRSVRLSINRSEVGDHRLSAPGIEAGGDADRAATEDRVISEEEALSQRERMERELAGQSARLERERREST